MSSLAPHRPPKMADDATVASSTAMDIEKASTSPPSPPTTDADLEKSSHVPPSPPKPLAFEPNDPDDPHNWPLWRQRCYSLILGYATLSLTFNSSAYVCPAFWSADCADLQIQASSVPELMAAFNMSYVVACALCLVVLRMCLTTAQGPWRLAVCCRLRLCAQPLQAGPAAHLLAVGPLFFGPASEVFGRRPIYLASFFVFTAFSIGAAVANNAAALLLCRFFAGLGGASALTNAPPSMSDVRAPACLRLFADVLNSSPIPSTEGASPPSTACADPLPLSIEAYLLHRPAHSVDRR